jgi:hypothetical protein
MTVQTGSAPTSGPRAWRALRLAGALLRSGDASVGLLDSAVSLIARRGSQSRSWLPADERGRAAPSTSCMRRSSWRPVWAIARWRAPILGEFVSPGSCSA